MEARHYGMLLCLLGSGLLLWFHTRSADLIPELGTKPYISLAHPSSLSFTHYLRHSILSATYRHYARFWSQRKKEGSKNHIANP